MQRDPNLLTFDEFVNEYVVLLETNRWGDVDAHLYPQPWHLLPIRYKKVIRIDRLSEQMEQLFPRQVFEKTLKRKANVPSDTPCLVRLKNKRYIAGSFSEAYRRTGLLPGLEMVLNAKTEARLKRVYQDDHIMINECEDVGELLVKKSDLHHLKTDDLSYEIALPNRETDYI